LIGLVRSRTVLIDEKWAPVVRPIVDTNHYIRNPAERESGVDDAEVIGGSFPSTRSQRN